MRCDHSGNTFFIERSDSAIDTKSLPWWKVLRGRIAAWPAGSLQRIIGLAQRLSAAMSGRLEPVRTLQVDRVQWELLKERLEASGRRRCLYDGSRNEYARITQHIRQETFRHNRNNVTRTAAYLEFYRRFPELHWAFLAHMVSRNGGWNMTDLQGELLPHLIDETQRKRLFAMLEQSNALIFGDAYPQLLLYEASVRAARPLFFLLPEFGVSSFMLPVWELFWEQRDPTLVTMSLIVNEQHVVEGHVISRPSIQEHVLGTIPFQGQSALQLNQVFFPYADRAAASRQRRIAGLVVENFGSLQERIAVGRTLYAILFAIPGVAEGARAFAEHVPHTGSRADYWPELFTAERRSGTEGAYTQQRLQGRQLRANAPRFFSPSLEAAWNDQPLREPERYDWFRSAGEACGYLVNTRPPYPYEMSDEHCFGLHKLELAILAAEAASKLHHP